MWGGGEFEMILTKPPFTILNLKSKDFYKKNKKKHFYLLKSVWQFL